MAMVVHNFDEPERFVAGTVGPPGQRTFFLQARDPRQLVSVTLEKQQVTVLAERMDLLLDEILRRSGGDARIPAVAPEGLYDGGPLEQPIEEEFRVGTMTLEWDGDSGKVVVEMFPVSEESVTTVEGGDSDAEQEIEVEVEADEVMIVRLNPGYARSFVRRAQSVVAAGRPACPFCGGPVDPSGHVCPRANGFKRVAE